MINVNHLSKWLPVGKRRKALILPWLPFPTVHQLFAMPLSSPTPGAAPAADAAVLLVLLPPVGTARPVRAATLAAMLALQQQLGNIIQVLSVDEDSHPAVVRSFQPADLPAFVLVRQGVELWRQQGLPEGEFYRAPAAGPAGPAGPTPRQLVGPPGWHFNALKRDLLAGTVRSFTGRKRCAGQGECPLPGGF